MVDQFVNLEAQIHNWPWAAEISDESTGISGSDISFPFYGSPIISLSSSASLFLPRRSERFIPLGSPYKHEKQYRIFETPHGVVSGTEGNVKVRMLLNKKRHQITFSVKGAEPKYTDSESRETSLMYQHVLSWSQFFDDLFENTQKKDAETNSVTWETILGMLEELATPSIPRMSLIVRIAEEMQISLPETVSRMRKILVRRHEMAPAKRAFEMDNNCVKWLIRQPGYTVAEKAGYKQKLKAVIRKESYDTLENRVLKDFTRRCRLSSHTYIKNEVGTSLQMKSSTRFKTIKSFKTICNMCLSEVVFDEVSVPQAGFRSNYVLQNDARYKTVWKWYKKLLRQDDEVDQVWDWQARSWADICRLFVGCALKLGLNDFKDPIPLIDGPLLLSAEQKLGCRILPGSEPGPFILTKANQNLEESRIIEIIHPDLAEDHAIASQLGRTGGHHYIITRPIANQNQVSEVFILWSVNTAGVRTEIDIGRLAESAYSSLEQHKIHLNRRRTGFPKLYGFIIASNTKNQNAIPHKAGNGKLAVLEAPADIRGWQSAVEQLSILLSDLFQGCI
jgi:hypothetical protein